MRTFNISSEQLNDAIERLWNVCRVNGATFSLDPIANKMFVYSSGETIAVINVIDVTDYYCLDEVFKS